MQSPDNSQTWIIYHATPNYTMSNGWPNRKGRCQLLEYRSELPFAQPPVALGTVVPSGSVIPAQSNVVENVPGQVALVKAAKNDSAVTKFKLKGKKVWQVVKGKLSVSNKQKK